MRTPHLERTGTATSSCRPAPLVSLCNLMPTDAHSDRCVLTAGHNYVNAGHENRELSESLTLAEHSAEYTEPPVRAPIIRRASGVCVAFTE